MDFKNQVDILVQKIRHLLILSSGHTSKEASIEEFYQAFCSALMEEVMINWTTSLNTIAEKKTRIAYFLSLEYLPGRFLKNNIINIGASELIQAVLAKLERNFGELVECETDAGLGNGGLGRLSSCFLDSLATLQYPAMGYGLRYQYGIFEQEIWNGIQVERPDCWLLNVYPWEIRRDAQATATHFRGRPVHAKNRHGDEVYLLEDFEEVRALPYDVPILGFKEFSDFSVLTLRLWSTKESPRNFLLQRYNAGFLDQAAENTSLTDVLYPNDNTELGKRMRLKQEFLLVSSSLYDIARRHFQIHGDMSSFADKVRIQINDTHPALIIAELMRTLTKNFDFSWKDAWETCQACCSYTNHTILSESLEEWNEHRVSELLPRQYRIIQKINQDFCQRARERFPSDEERIRRLSILEGGQIRMAHFAIVGSHKVNGVAHLHTEILKKKIFKDLYEMFPEKLLNVTNGVSHRRWLLFANPPLAELITECIGKDWIFDFSQIEKFATFASNPQTQEKFLAIKKQNKENLLYFLTHQNAVRNEKGRIIAHSFALDSSALFDVQIKRFHEYKRQLLSLLHLLMIYYELLEKPDARKVCRLAIFGGKAAPGYKRAKEILQLLYALARKFHAEETMQKKLVVAIVENYNVTQAERIIPAADLSEQVSTAGWEASGTGNMKLAMNGALTIGTEDGANVEMRQAVTDAWWPFRFGATAEENEKPYDPQAIYEKDLAIRRAVDTLIDGTLAETEEEKEAFADIHQSLVRGDSFRILQDLRSYHETQKKVEELYLNPQRWAETAIHNIAAMGNFTTDRSIREYAEKVWNIEPCPLDSSIMEKVRTEYSEHARLI